MTDAEYRKQRARVQRLLDKWQAPLGLGWWKVTHYWYRESLNDDHPDDGQSNIAADTKVNWPYMEAAVRWCLPIIAEQTDARIEWLVLHELCHILVNEMRAGEDTARLDHEERVCSTLAAAFVWADEAATKRAKKAK